MKREDLLKEMKECIGSKDPIEFFDKLTDMFSVLFDKLDKLEADNKRLQLQTALAISWEPRVASKLISNQVNILRARDRDSFDLEIQALKVAFAEDVVTQSYELFCDFWVDTLGYHPFLD